MDKRQAGAKRINTVVMTLSHIVEQARKGNRKAFFLRNEILSAPHIFWLSGYLATLTYTAKDKNQTAILIEMLVKTKETGFASSNIVELILSRY